ncbi:hypothetical protein O9G_001331 [Rozella allomycis CSF55]|uniref:Late embryogenesis abundant protein LEA-2 subgroup domain-containing protein n=1 Tax=Rozella allomycis (strain CSF55) TaxID=988480 RepID=A0A075AV42_ROZAC|nr:hypothetical protein O9G_001331 [Rozella allomycis CSF55]|eukprot:EPZ32429.1 hypothetical protein O9G_001331 [Rozella allomycis CSF55]
MEVEKKPKRSPICRAICYLLLFIIVLIIIAVIVLAIIVKVPTVSITGTNANANSFYLTSSIPYTLKGAFELSYNVDNPNVFSFYVQSIESPINFKGSDGTKPEIGTLRSFNEVYIAEKSKTDANVGVNIEYAASNADNVVVKDILKNCGGNGSGKITLDFVFALKLKLVGFVIPLQGITQSQEIACPALIK